MRIEYSRRFVKELKRAPRNIQTAFRNRLALFIDNPAHPLLRIHSLVGQLKDCYSFSITGDWRVIYKIYANGDMVLFVMLGTHSQLYK